MLKRCVSILCYRYHTIPPLIAIVFGLSIGLSYERSPEHYKEQKVFHLSSLGNWQEGLSYFSVGLVLIANLMHLLASEILKQRMKQIGYCGHEERRNGGSDPKDNSSPKEPPCSNICCTLPCLYWIGSAVLYLGLVLTGCFQQSFNKPWHTIGVISMGIGFNAMFLYDVRFAWCRKAKLCANRKTEKEKVCANRKRSFAKWSQIILFAVICASGICFVSTHFAAKIEWNAGKDEKLKELFEAESITEEKCPGKTINDWLKGEDYPNFYPCKSKSLWSKEDPGFNLYSYSGYAEIVMFTAVVLYSFTYCLLLERQENPWWDCAPKFCKNFGKDTDGHDPAEERPLSKDTSEAEQ